MKNLLSFGLIVVAALAGCSSATAKKYRVQPPVSTTLTSAAVTATPGDYAPGSIALYVSNQQETTCGMAHIPAVAFPDDKLPLGPVQSLMMQTLAQCFTSGPLAGRTILLIAEANPSGDVAYDLNLAAVHAAMIRDLLVANGVAPERFVIASSNERCTQGVRPHQDRVEILTAR